jgi:hypothetical protein
MSYAMLYDVPADEEMYRQVNAAIGDEKPDGLVVHLVLQADSGLRHIDVWDSQQDWQRFRDDRLEPAVRAVLTAAGLTEMPPAPRVQEFKLVDVWIGA